MLTYENDPLLNKYSGSFVLNGNVLNLYSAFVKKEDFIKKGKKIQPLQKSTYVKVNKEIIDKIKNRYTFEETSKLIEYYTGLRNNIKRRLNIWYKNCRIPFLLLRLTSLNKEEFSKWTLKIEYFTDFLNKSRFNPPRRLNDLLSPKWVYFVGCSMGDGHIEKNQKRWVLVDGSSHKEELKHSKVFVLKLGRLLKKHVDNFKINEYETKYELVLNNKQFCRFLNYFFGLPFGKKKNITLEKPKIINSELERYFWRGMFDTDGGAKYGNVNFSSSDPNILTQCKKFLSRNDIEFKNSSPNFYIPINELNKFKKIGFSHPRKQNEFLNILKKGPMWTTVKMKNNNEVNQKLLNINHLLRVDKNYRVRIRNRDLKNCDISEDKLREIIKELFGYDLKRTGNLLYFKSKRVYNYLNEHFIYESPWKALGDKELLKLGSEWGGIFEEDG